jgi:hypothetical protein
MTLPQFTPVVEQNFEKKDPEEYLPWKRCTQTQHRRGKLLIVRPLKMIADFRPLTEDQKARKAKLEAEGKEFWRGDLCVADIACLDPIESVFDELGKEWKGFPAGHQWREETIMLGYLNAAFKEYIGHTVIGTVYPQKTQFPQPAIRWMDLAGDPASVDRAQKYLIAFPDFLVPRSAQIVPVVANAAPVSGAPQGNAYTSGDPWAQEASQGVSAAQTQHPNQGMNTLEQLKAARQDQNAQGFPQSQDPPF